MLICQELWRLGQVNSPWEEEKKVFLLDSTATIKGCYWLCCKAESLFTQTFDHNHEFSIGSSDVWLQLTKKIYTFSYYFWWFLDFILNSYHTWRKVQNKHWVQLKPDLPAYWKYNVKTTTVTAVDISDIPFCLITLTLNSFLTIKHFFLLTIYSKHCYFPSTFWCMNIF